MEPAPLSTLYIGPANNGEHLLSNNALSKAGNHSPPFAKSIQVCAKDSVWGINPSEFWQQCKQDLEASLYQLRSEDMLRSVATKLREKMSAPKPSFLAFDNYRGSSSEKFVALQNISSNSIWFIGDLHGDILSFVALNEFISRNELARNNNNFNVTLLGDIVDDGPYDCELLCQVFDWMIRAPQIFSFIVGNHDDGIAYDQIAGHFHSTVSPSDFCGRLNALSPGCAMRDLTMAGIEFFKKAPCAMLLPDGLLVAHGGVPHLDLHDQLREPGDLNKTVMINDFIWTRIHEAARHKVPNRTTRGCSLGFEDFDAFCDKATGVLGRPIRSMLRGHDHVPERFLIHDRYVKHPVLTINAMCSKQRGDVFGPRVRKPVVVRWCMGLPLEIYQVEIPEWLIGHFYGCDPEQVIPEEVA